ncbi:hemerythrin domain-containing protein [Saccharibacillus sp. CPCC 101409]|uniref:hemerythrin domain-containing protein n=1 Tax=Saccharibacillus sp. CPCC 101409 TaxID=3058041 RepID=UPI002673464B|nr:hemerythrin domain-containing protein [Saccharibacillus sp. CPCC 101409]MDO3412331.1 hemerythrin domain-containing protein [Saccharibacillus sp. CPCC 101409]
MGGPSLRQLHAHHAIHEGGLSGAVDKTEEVFELLRAGEFEVARQAADHLVDYWVTRVLSHADAEEEGFYEEMAGDDPELKIAVVKLTRDHDILRMIIADIKTMLAEEGLTPEVMQQFQALMVVNAIHSREEERLLLGGGH